MGAGVKLLALFDFSAVERSELSLKEGDVVHGVDLRGMWWWGYNDKGLVGEFPVTHVQALEAALATEAEDIQVKCLDTGDKVSAALLNTSVDVAIEQDSDEESEGGDLSSSPQHTELKRGYMLKRSVWWRRWRQRFFILEPGVLKMYIVETDAPKKLISLDGARLAYSSLRSKGAFRITLKGAKEIIYLCAYTDEERNDWMNKISRARPSVAKVTAPHDIGLTSPEDEQLVCAAVGSISNAHMAQCSAMSRIFFLGTFGKPRRCFGFDVFPRRALQ